MNNPIMVPNFKILKNGNPLAKDILLAISSVSVQLDINVPASFTIRFSSVYFTEGKLRGIDLDIFKIGDEIKISMGNDSTEELIVGEISAVDFDFSDEPSIELQGYDKMYQLQFSEQQGPFSQMTDQQMITKIVRSVGMSIKADSTSTVYSFLDQGEVDNYNFIKQRAERIGYEIFMEGETFVFRQFQQQSAKVTLKYGIDLSGFSIGVKEPPKGNQVEVRAWNPETKEEIVSRFSIKTQAEEFLGEKFTPAFITITDEPIIDISEADNVAQAKCNELLKDFLVGRGSCQGNPLIKPGITIELDGIGKNLSGEYYVSSTTHSISDNEYTTSFAARKTGGTAIAKEQTEGSSRSSGGNKSIGSSSDGFVEVLEQLMEQASINGVLVGIITNVADPQNLGRVKVKFPRISSTDESGWIRIATLMAGGDCGTFFVPEVDDEVLVAFEFGDINMPYVIGGLWNGKDLPPHKIEDGKNDVRLIKSRKGHIIKLNDSDEEETVEIIDKSGKNKITISTKDNKISIASEQDIEILCPNGTFSVQSKNFKIDSEKINITATGENNIKGSKINLN